MSIFNPIAWTLHYINYSSVSVGVFLVFYLFFHLEHSPRSSHFVWFFSVCPYAVMQNSYLSLSWRCYPYVDVSSYSLPVFSGFGAKPESEVRTGYVFAQGALAADTLVGHKVGWRGSSQSQVWARASPRLHGSWHPKGGGAGVQGAGVRALNELGFSPPQWWSQPWLGVGPKPKVLEPQISATSAFPQDNVGLCLVWGQSQGPRG